jgi:hypothetical protein
MDGSLARMLGVFKLCNQNEKGTEGCSIANKIYNLSVTISIYFLRSSMTGLKVGERRKCPA